MGTVTPVPQAAKFIDIPSAPCNEISSSKKWGGDSLSPAPPLIPFPPLYRRFQRAPALGPQHGEMRKPFKDLGVQSLASSCQLVKPLLVCLVWDHSPNPAPRACFLTKDKEMEVLSSATIFCLCRCWAHFWGKICHHSSPNTHTFGIHTPSCPLKLRGQIPHSQLQDYERCRHLLGQLPVLPLPALSASDPLLTHPTPSPMLGAGVSPCPQVTADHQHFLPAPGPQGSLQCLQLLTPLPKSVF